MPRASPARTSRTSPSTARALTAVGYLRRSTDRQEQSIPDQRRAIEAFATTHNLRIVRFYTDDAISGTSTSERPAFQQMIADARSGGGGGFSRVIVYDVKRFGRIDNDEAGYYRHLLRSCGVEVMYASENFSGDSTDDLLRPVKQWQARQESKDLAKVTIRGLVSKATSATKRASEERSGGWMGGAPPFGYDLRYQSSSRQFIFTVRHQPDGSKLLLDKRGKPIRTIPRGETLGISKKDRAHLVPSDPARVAIVREVFRMYTEEGRGYKAIAEALNRAGTPTARGKAWSDRHAGLWSVGSVRAILTNPAYAGDLVWNRRTDARFFRITGDGHAVARTDTPGVSRRLSHNDERDWMVTKDAHEPLVSKRVFQHARDRLAERSKEADRVASERPTPPPQPEGGWPGARSPKARFLLSGLCRCAKCGSRYEGHGAPTGNRTSDRPREKVWSYACGGYIRHGRSTCQRGGVGQRMLEHGVVNAVRAYYERFASVEGRNDLGREVDRLLLGEGAGRDDAKARLTKRIDKIDRSVRNLLDNISPATKDMAERRLLELEREKSECSRELVALESLTATRREARAMADEAGGFLISMVEMLGSEPGDRAAAIAAALRRCVQQVTVDAAGGSATLHLRTLPVLAAGPAFQTVEQVTIDLR